MALDQWRLTLGGREDWVHTGTTILQQGRCHQHRARQEIQRQRGDQLRVRHGFVPYLSYAESFQPTSNAVASPTESFKPTEGKQWELGIKYQPPGSNTLLTAAVYDLTQKNVSVTTQRRAT